MADYAGWWVFSNDVPGRSDEPIFIYLELPAEAGGEFACYDERGLSIGSGTVDFSGMRHVIGNPLIVLELEDYGQVNINPMDSEDDYRLIEIQQDRGDPQWYTFSFLEEPPFDPGVTTIDIPGIDDYAGWWQYTGSDDAPAYYMEIFPDGGVLCYDENGAVTGEGVTDYDEQRALNGNPLMAFYFDSLGTFVSHGDTTDDGKQDLWIMPEDEWYDPDSTAHSYDYAYLETPPSFEGNSGSAEPNTETDKDTATILTDLLADQMEGKAVLETGEEEINGELCKLFQFGTDTPERFEAERHFAVSPDGDVYTMDILQGPDWIPYP
jgi:hypothetical protein